MFNVRPSPQGFGWKKSEDILSDSCLPVWTVLEEVAKASRKLSPYAPKGANAQELVFLVQHYVSVVGNVHKLSETLTVL